MAQGLLTFFPALMVASAMAVGIRHAWLRCPGLEERGGAGGFRRWWMRGFAVPVALWFAWGLLALWGPAWGISPPTPDLGGRAASLAAGLAIITLLTGMAWTSFSLAWLLPDVIPRIRRRAELRGWVLIVGLPALALDSWAALRHQWMLLALVTTVALWAILNAALKIIHAPSVNYTRAVSRIKSGKYAEAEQAILSQLEEKEDDFEGWMMLATLYVEQFNELPEARATIRALSDQPGLTPYQVAHAFNRLADWELKLGRDPVGARAALLEIVERCPGTPFARVAEHRIRQLPLDQAELEEQRHPRTLSLPALSERRSPAAVPGDPHVASMDARAEESQLTSRLQQRPEDAELRIRLARLLAERMNRVGEALQHLSRARQLPDRTSLQLADWLALEASWELRLRHRDAEARLLLEQILREHPETPQALASRRQLDLLDQAAAMKDLQVEPLRPPPRIRVGPSAS